jgi:carboxymethylenebutenolidase
LRAKGALGGYLSRPAGKGPYPGVIVIHENRGVTEYIKDVTRNLARAGYVGLSVNLVSRSLGADYSGGSDDAMNALGKLSVAEARADLHAGAEYLKKQPVVFINSIGYLGFCMGGWFSLLYAAQRKNVKAAVVFYGRTINEITPLQPQSPVGLVPEITALLLGNHGAADAGIPVDDVRKLEEELKKNNKTCDIKIYPGAKHAFHREGPNYHRGGMGCLTVKDYCDFLCILFDVWYNNGQPVASIRLFENIPAIGMGVEAEICAFKDQCGSYKGNYLRGHS